MPEMEGVHRKWPSLTPYGSMRRFPSSRKQGKPQNSRKKIIFQIGTLNPNGINEHVSFN